MIRAACVVGLLVLAGATASSADAPNDLAVASVPDPLLGRMAAYVDGFEKAVSGVVAEEHYEQNVTPRIRGMAGGQLRRLRSDVLWTRVDESGWLAFRDVYDHQARAAAPRSVTIGGSAMMRRATAGDFPEYPKDSLAKGVAGVVVVEVVADTDGRTTEVTVLQAPDRHIADATRESLLKWRFEPLAYLGEKVNVRAKVIWYFLVEGARARVVPASPVKTNEIGSIDEYPMISERDWQRLQKGKSPPVLLDVAPRGASIPPLESALRIPEDELSLRATVELPRSAVIVVDCPSKRAEYCSAAARQLSALGYRSVMLLVRN